MAVGSGIAAARKEPDTLRLRQLSIVDTNGVERVRIGAPLPEPPMLGKRFHRDGPISGILLFDAEGNERTGYATSLRGWSRGAKVRDASEHQWRKIWRLVCKGRQVEYDENGIDYLVAKWYRPVSRPFRMCHPRDILDQMISIGKYNMERVTFDPDLIDAACATYFISTEKKDFGAKVRFE